MLPICTLDKDVGVSYPVYQGSESQVSLIAIYLILG